MFSTCGAILKVTTTNLPCVTASINGGPNFVDNVVRNRSDAITVLI